ncbi:MAG TPA: PAS domain S-box protein [Pyrinomonadaceae bacterium]|jgi:PAS domain S-box-containing protein|nr:PAS domain S-box protein [Pyrinomonadaceae bacterium]
MQSFAPQTLNGFNGAFTHAAVGIAVTDLNFRFIEVNESFCRITGYSAAELKETDSLSITDSAYRKWNRELLRKLVTNEMPALVLQKPYVTKIGNSVWVQNSVYVVRSAEGLPINLIILAEDISDRKAAQSALKESEERFRVQFKATPVPIFSWRRVQNDFVLVDYNNAADRMTGHGIIDLIGLRASHLYVNTPEVLKYMESCFKQKKTIQKSGEFRLLSTGELKHLDVRFVFVPPDLVMIHTEDITERVEAERARLEAERQYRDMFENANQGMVQTTPDGRFQAANPALAHMLGFISPEELIKERTNIGEQHYVDSARREEFKRQMELHGMVRGFEYEAYKKNGSRIWLSASVRAARDASEATLFYEGIVEDITERKRSQDELRKQKELLQTIFDHIPVMISFIDQKGGVQLFNRESECILGWSSEELLRGDVDIFEECYPDAAERAEVMKFISEGTGQWKNFRTRVRSGATLDTVWANVKIADGISISIGKDITQDKRAERFRDAEASLSHGLTGSTSPLEVATLITEVADSLIGWDSCYLQLYDSEKDSIQTIFAIDEINGIRTNVTPSDRIAPSGKVRSVIESGATLIIRTPPLAFEATAIPFGDLSRPSGTIMTVPIHYGTGTLAVLSIQSYECNAYDQQSLKDLQSLADLCGEALNRIRAEQSLFESEERFRQIAENIEDIIWVVDTGENKLLYVNPSYETIWKRPTESVYQHNKSYLDNVHPEDRDRVERLMKERLGDGACTSFEYRILRPDGSVRWIRSRSFPIRDAEGRPYRIAGVAEDITERKAAETALREYSRRLLDAQESERMHIARELHDEIGQVLTAVRMNLQSLQQDRTSQHDLAEGIRVIDEALKRVRDLSLELRPSLLDDLGLAAASRWYVDRFARRAGVKAELQIDFESLQTRLPREVETACFRILQEALTNIGRHARAKQIAVLLTIVDSQLFLSVKDDGIGIEGSSSETAGNSQPPLGLRGMEERALAVSGHFEIISALALGTEVRVRFPISLPETLSAVAHG